MSSDIGINIRSLHVNRGRQWETSYADLQVFDVSGVVSGIVHLAVALERDATARTAASRA